MTFEKAFHKALNYLAKSPKTIGQMKIYLSGKGYEDNLADQVVGKLIELDYLNDRTFAKRFIESRIRYKPKSVFALGFELRKKGIAPVLAQELLSTYDDQELALKAIEPKKQTWKCLSEPECKKKIMNFLRYRGFDYHVCNTVWHIFLSELRNLHP